MTGNLSEYRRLLKVGPAEGAEDLKAAYRRSARAVHPDLHPEDPDAAAKFAQVQKAFAVLTAMAQYQEARRVEEAPLVPSPEVRWTMDRLESRGLDRIYHLTLAEEGFPDQGRLRVPVRAEKLCPRCGGKGRTRGRGLAFLLSPEEICPQCLGRGSVHGVGRVAADLPKSAAGPLSFRYKGRGGLDPQTGQRGDLILNVAPGREGGGSGRTGEVRS